MNPLHRDRVNSYIQDHIEVFHAKRLNKLMKLDLLQILKRKNPYLFKAKNVVTAEVFIRGILDAHLSSQEETLFGDFLEGVATFVCEQVFGGYKPPILEFTGVDLIFKLDDKLFIVEIKSGPYWGNSSQISKMMINFEHAKRLLREQYPDKEIIAVNGCSYGKEANQSKKDGAYWKLCGQDFWQFVSGDPDLYIEIIKPLGYEAQQRDEQLQAAYTAKINQFTRQFLQDYCDENGVINWVQIIQFVSERDEGIVFPF